MVGLLLLEIASGVLLLAVMGAVIIIVSCICVQQCKTRHNHNNNNIKLQIRSVIKVKNPDCISSPPMYQVAVKLEPISMQPSNLSSSTVGRS